MLARHIVWLTTLLLWACAPEPDTLAQDERPESVNELYASDMVWHIAIELSDDNRRALESTPRRYVRGDLRIGNARIEDVGIRLKGQFSFQGLGGKASFKIKFNRFVEGQRFLGLEKLTLNNMRQDRSQLHEWLSYQIFRAAGVPAARSGFAQVTLNGALYGLYANVETMDDRFLREHFEGAGNLYEAPWGADLDAEAVDAFEQDEGEDRSREDLDELVLRVAEPDDRVFFGSEALIDTDEFLRFMAAEAVVGHWDGYWKSNNYFIHHDLSRDLWSFHPWGLDQSLDRDIEPFSSAGVLAKKCLSLPSCKSEYARLGLEVVAAAEALGLDQGIDQLAAHIELYVEDDPRSPHPPEKARRFQDITRARLEATPDRLRERFDCIEDMNEVDRDEDGFGACLSDCNDSSAAAYPGASEICDGLDNDCDGQVDEVECACEEHEVTGSHLLFCPARVPWTIARDECAARGARLADLQKEQARSAAFAIAAELDPALSWYLSANDREQEGQWKSAEGKVMNELAFAPGEPDDFGEEDCAVLASFAEGAWSDEKCTTPLPYICERLP